MYSSEEENSNDRGKINPSVDTCLTTTTEVMSQHSVNPTTKNVQESADKIKTLTRSLNSEGHVLVDGDKMSFVSKDFFEQLQSSGSSRNASPTSSVSSTSKLRNFDIPQINPDIISKLEHDCLKMTNSVDGVIAELTQRLHKISAISVANTQACEDKVEEMTTRVDSVVHSMYSLVAHCEELDKSMKPIYDLAEKITNINEILSALEANIH